MLNHSVKEVETSLSSHFLPDGASYVIFSLYIDECFLAEDFIVNYLQSLGIVD